MKLFREIFELLLFEDVVFWVGWEEGDDVDVDGLLLIILKCEWNIVLMCFEWFFSFLLILLVFIIGNKVGGKISILV